MLNGKSVYPSAVEELYQVEGSASSARGELVANRSTKSGLLMNGRPKAIISARPSEMAISEGLADMIAFGPVSYTHLTLPTKA